MRRALVVSSVVLPVLLLGCGSVTSHLASPGHPSPAPVVSVLADEPGHDVRGAEASAVAAAVSIPEMLNRPVTDDAIVGAVRAVAAPGAQVFVNQATADLSSARAAAPGQVLVWVGALAAKDAVASADRVAVTLWVARVSETPARGSWSDFLLETWSMVWVDGQGWRVQAESAAAGPTPGGGSTVDAQLPGFHGIGA